MSIYDWLGVTSVSHPYDVETAGKSAMRTLNTSTLKSWLTENGKEYSDASVAVLLEKMHQHVAVSTTLLLDPGLKDCYDAWMQTSAQDTRQQTLTKARMMYVNSLNGAVSFGEGCFEKFSDKLENITIDYRERKTDEGKLPRCRWCKESFDLSSLTIYQCSCSARVGHVACGKTFASEYKNRCPVCRAQLLERKEISKYMFWGIDNKFKL